MQISTAKRISFIAIIFFSLTSCEKSANDKGMAFYQSKKYEDAIMQFSTYLEKHPQDADTYFNRGRAYEQMKNYEDALKDFQSAIKADPSKEAFWLSSGIVNFKMKKFDATVSNMEGLLELQERNGKAMVLMARAYAQMGGQKIGSAMKVLNEAISLDQKNGDAYLYRGLIRANANDTKACSDFEQAKRLKIRKAIEFLNKYCE